MALVSVVEAVITANTTKFKTAMANASKQVDTFAAKAAKAGPAMTKSLTLPMIGVGVASIKAASDFEASMVQIETLVGRSAKEVEQLTESVLELSGETARAPKELADAMFFITSAGLPAAEATQTLEYAAKAAAIGLGKTEQVADAVTNAINGYGKENISAALATDILAKTVEQGKASAETLAPTFGRLIPMAAELGIEFDEVGGGLAYLTRSSGDAAMSATQLGQVMRTVLKPSQQAREALDQIGISTADLRAGVEDDFLGTLIDLRQKLEDNGMELSNVFENARALIGALSLTARGGEEAAGVMDAMRQSSGKVDEAFARVQETAQFKLNKSLTELKTALVDVGNVLVPIIVPVLKTMAELVGTVAGVFGKLEGATKKVTVALIGLVAMAGPLTSMGTNLAAGFTSITRAGTGTAAIVGTKKGGLTQGFGKLLGVVKKHPVAFIGAAAATTALTIGLKALRGESKRSKERMQSLRSEFTEANDPATGLVENMKSLAEELRAVSDASDDTATNIKDLVGDQTLLNELIKQDGHDAFKKLDIAMTDVIDTIKGGTDDYQDLLDSTSDSKYHTDQLIESFRNAPEHIRGVTSQLADLVEAEEITAKEARNVIDSLDETADAFDDNREKNDELAKKYFESGEVMSDFAHIIGSDLIAEIHANAKENENWAESLGDVNDAVALMTGDFGLQGFMDSVAGATDFIVDTEEPLDTMEENLGDVTAELDAQQEAMDELVESFDELINMMNDNIEAAYDFDLATIAVTEGQMALMEAVAALGDEELSAFERQKALTGASKEYADNLSTLAQSMTDMPLDEINKEFDNQAGFLDALKGTIPDTEYERLVEMLNNAKTAAQNLHGTEIMIDYEITGTYDPSMLRFLETMQSYGGVEAYASSVASFVTPMAEGGIVTRPTMGLVGEAGPEAIIPLDRLGSVGGGTSVVVNVEGSVLTEYDLAETIQNQLIRIKGRNASLEFD